jgi:dipeptidyl aminopeptidase/acylaminoacyl peptidase
MPDVQEVFRMATEKVKPDPNALERQVRRQRKSSRGSRAKVYATVAAVLAAVAVALFAIRASISSTDVVGNPPSPAPTFVDTIPPGAQLAKPVQVNLGGRTSPVTGLPEDAYSLSYASDAGRIAFIAKDDLDLDRLGVLDPGGEPQMVPTPDGMIIGSSVGIGTAALSPDGTRIAFEAMGDGNSDVYVIAVDGSGLVRLTDDPATDQYPQWSPDGTTIVYDNAGSREDRQDPQFSKTAEIYTVPADGSARPTRLTRDNVGDAGASFSPDGRKIAYSHGGFELWVMAADGSNRRRLAGVSVGGFTPRWSPDGSTVAFTNFSGAYRPLVALGSEFGERPLVIAQLIDVATGRVSKLPTIGMASDYNTPQWMDDGHLLISSVRVH